LVAIFRRSDGKIATERDVRQDRHVPTEPPPPNLTRFSGFADLYDANRPTAPARLGPLLARYAGRDRPVVVDLGSGTGLSSRWAAGWAGRVIGIEPNDDMRAVAIARGGPGVEYRAGVSHATGLADDSADIVIAVQAMHWMEPLSTHTEVARVLRPGGVFAIVDADWPPVSGVVAAEEAWVVVHQRIRVLEARLARGLDGAALRAPIDVADPELAADDDLADPHLDRTMLDATSWSKRDHLRRLRASGHFAYAREVLMDQDGPGGAATFVALLRSQGSYQHLVKVGLDDDDIGVAAFAEAVAAAFAAAGPVALSFSYRARLGVTPR
jgi:SAM-dependent methyltransferase